MERSPTPRLIIIDDGPPGALTELMAMELPDTLALVSSKRARPQGIRRGVWISDTPLRQLLPQSGPVRVRVTSDLQWRIARLDSATLRELLPPAEPGVALAVALQVLGHPLPISTPEDRVLDAWREAVRGWGERDLDAARQAITIVNRRWPTWRPGWSFADEVYTSLGLFEIALACRCRAGEPPMFRLRRPKVRKVA